MMFPAQSPKTSSPDISRPKAGPPVPSTRLGSALLAAAFALILVLGSCGDDDTTTTSTSASDATADQLTTDDDGADPSSEIDADADTSDSGEQPDPDFGDPALGPPIEDPSLAAGGGGSTFNPVAGEWILQSLTIEGDMAIPLEEILIPTMTVQGTEVTGNTGCNNFSFAAEYDIAGDSFSGDFLEMTEEGCDGIEQWFVQALSSVTTFTSEPGVLILTDGADAPTTMRFVTVAQADNPAEELGE